MKGIYVIAIAFLASWAVNAATLIDSDQLEQSDLKEDSFQPPPTVPPPIKCPFPERFPENTTTNLPHEWDCTRFYKCFLGKGVEQLCPLMIKGDPVSRLHYNRLLQVCDWPWQAGCSSCPGKNLDGSYPDPSLISGPDNCRQYYQCDRSGLPSLFQCPAYTCFSRTCQACVPYRDGGNCDNIPTSPTTSPTLPTSPSTCPPSNPNGDTKEHECDCAKYYTCQAPDWITDGQCYGGLHYSPTRKICLPPNEAGCRIPYKQ